jgi:hypothetical protein
MPQQRNNNLHEIEGNVIRESEKAYLFKPHESPDAAWIPKSQTTWHPEDQIMVIPEWLCERNSFTLPSLQAVDKKTVELDDSDDIPF